MNRADSERAVLIWWRGPQGKPFRQGLYWRLGRLGVLPRGPFETDEVLGSFVIEMLGAVFLAGFRTCEHMLELEGDGTALFDQQHPVGSSLESLREELHRVGVEVAGRTVTGAPDTTPRGGVLAGFIAGASYMFMRVARDRGREDDVSVGPDEGRTSPNETR